MADYNENPTETLPSISDSYAESTQVVGQEDSNPAETLPAISDSYAESTQVVGQEDSNPAETLPAISDSYTTDPECISADFTANSVSVSVWTEVNFTDTSTGSPDTFLWDFGDGGTSTDQNPTHIYTVPGLYTVVLTASRTDLLSSTTDTETKTDYLRAYIGVSFTGTLYITHNVQPTETYIKSATRSYDYLSSEVNKLIDAESVTSGSITGYSGGNPYYLEAEITGSVPDTITDGKFILIKNTGHYYYDTSEYGRSNTNCILVTTSGGIVLGLYAKGEPFIMHSIVGGIDISGLLMKTVDSSGNTIASGSGNAVEVLFAE